MSCRFSGVSHRLEQVLRLKVQSTVHGLYYPWTLRPKLGTMFRLKFQGDCSSGFGNT